MDISTAELSEQDLVAELEQVEAAIGRRSRVACGSDPRGRSRVRVGAELLALAERQQVIVQELRHRRRPPASAAA